jgi:hypothetical protein
LGGIGWEEFRYNFVDQGLLFVCHYVVVMAGGGQ